MSLFQRFIKNETRRYFVDEKIGGSGLDDAKRVILNVIFLTVLELSLVVLTELMASVGEGISSAMTDK